jgi:LuxR family maltose regulon positive regulatory protein
LSAHAESFNTPLIKTKLSAPQLRDDLVARASLLGQLRKSSLIPFLLVCAPAGYGKTTLLTAWIADIKKTSQRDNLIVCWLSLDEGDNDPIRFLSYLVAAFETAGIGVSAEAQTILQSTTRLPIQTVLAVLINDLEKPANPIYLVLDDYQFISNKAIHEGMAYVLDHLPSNVHLVIATRSDPPIPLARLRARGQMSEIRAGDLRFSYEEAVCFFNQIMGLSLTLEDITRLEERTEGWIASLQMAAIALRGIPQSNHSELSLFVKNFSGSNRYILDYLVEEVLSRQPQEIQDFLLRTSILESLCGSLCDIVTGVRSLKSEGEVSSSQQILEYLERSNLFLISLDSDRQWYRYHHLFASLLRSRLRQSLDAKSVQEFYLRASRWYESQGLLAEAITQALASPNTAYAAEILEKHILTFFYQGEITQVHRWLELLPESLLLQHPLLCAVYAASIALLPPYPTKSLPDAEKWMRAAEEAPPNDFPDGDLVRAFIYSIRSYWARFRGESPEIVLQITAKALSLLSPDSGSSMDRNQLFIRSASQAIQGLTYWDVGDEQAARQAFIEARRIGRACGDLLNESAAVFNLVQMSSLQGRLGEAVTLCRETLASFESRKAYLGHRTPHSAIIGVQLAEILIEQNELSEVDQLLKENIELANWTVSHDILLRGQLALARLSVARGNPSAAFEYLNTAEKISKSGAELAGAQRATLWLALRGNNPEYIGLARQWGQKVSLVEFTQGPPQMEWIISLALARLLLAEAESNLNGKTKEVISGLRKLLEWLERQKQAMQARGWAHWEIQLGVIECLAHRVMGDQPGSQAALRHALKLAAPGGYIRIFIEEGERLQKILAEMEKDAGWLLPYLRKLQLAFHETSGRLTVSPGIKEGLVEPLTAREIDILRTMAEGCSNHQIAEKFVLADGTVKFYVHAVLEKLGVHNRTQAVIEAKKLKII